MITSVGRNEPFLKLSVKEFLWGYEDEKACLDEESQLKDDEEAGFFEESLPAEELKKKNSFHRRKEFRSPLDGKCRFDALFDKNYTLGPEITMRTGAERVQVR